MFSYDIKFLTSDETIHLKNGDLKSFKYDTKKRVEESVYDVGKRSYCEKRGGYWRAPRPRQIRQLESKLRDRTVVTCQWTDDSLATLIFSSGVIAYVTFKPTTLDVTQILFDRYCVGRLVGQTVTGAVFSKSHLLFTHADRTATLISFGKNSTNIPCRISDRDPHLQNIELGGSARRADRRVSWCENGAGVRVLIWAATAAEPAPWSPVLEDHANLHLYNIHGQQISLVAYHQVENEALLAEVSHVHDNIVHVVEQTACHKNGVSLEWMRYDVSQLDKGAAKLWSTRDGSIRVSLTAPARTARRSPCDTRLLLATIDGSLHIIHYLAGLTNTTRAGFIATDVRWAGEMVMAAEEAGRLQCFDRALALLHHHTKCLDFATHLREPRRLQILATRGSRGSSQVLATFSGGPLTLLRITHPRLITAWMRMGRSNNAVALLRAMDWEREGPQCLRDMGHVVRAALRNRGTSIVTGIPGEETAQAALGAYLAAGAPLPPRAAASAPHVHDLARTFFHHLLRHGRIEKALSLGVDLAAWDLFADAGWAARRRGLPALADEAAASAAAHANMQRPESECSESCSQCSSHSYSDSDSETPSPKTVKTNPPPLPRVSIPSHPTVLSVPIVQNEPVSTASIRPNLHQYLERDNTIWSTDVRDDTYIGKPYNFNPLTNQNMRWNSVDNVLNFRRPSKSSLSVIEGATKSKTVVDVIPPNDERGNYRHLFQTELREELPNTMYRYHSNNNIHTNNANFNGRYRQDNWPSRPPEKNKVKFSDTVTIAVVSQEPSPRTEAELELADSLPLCPPHKYLAAFAPAPPAPHATLPAPLAPPGTTLDYVEV